MVAIYISYTSKYIYILYICKYIWVFINVYLSGLNVTKHLLKYQDKLSTLNLLPYFPLVKKIVETKTKQLDERWTKRPDLQKILHKLLPYFPIKKKRKNKNKNPKRTTSLSLRAFFLFPLSWAWPKNMQRKTFYIE